MTTGKDEKSDAARPLSHALYRDATVRSQIWRVRFAVGGYAVFGVLHLLAQVVQLPQLQGTQLKTERNGNRKDQAQRLSRKPSRFGRQHDRLGATVRLA